MSKWFVTELYCAPPSGDVDRRSPYSDCWWSQRPKMQVVLLRVRRSCTRPVGEKKAVLLPVCRSCTRPVRRSWVRMSPSSTRSSVRRATNSCVRCSTNTRTLLTRASNSPSRARCRETWSVEWSRSVTDGAHVDTINICIFGLCFIGLRIGIHGGYIVHLYTVTHLMIFQSSNIFFLWPLPRCLTVVQTWLFYGILQALFSSCCCSRQAVPQWRRQWHTKCTPCQEYT